MIYPKFYYCKHGNSDKRWILERMAYVPEAKQQEVSDEYERLYASKNDLRMARKAANTYLSGVAKEYHRESVLSRGAR